MTDYFHFVAAQGPLREISLKIELQSNHPDNATLVALSTASGKKGKKKNKKLNPLCAQRREGGRAKQ
ncbi:MAG TPA: hypothetical protein VL442_19200 [Mucilaginibacter sp.]|nr:hypothetical protein [Mucilaginibacter sp.]